MTAFQDGAWELYPPQTGWLAWDEAQTAQAIFGGEEWVALGPSSRLETLGINATADDSNRLILSANDSSCDHEGGGHQLKINKANETDTGNLVFQTGYQCHAEIGLAGNNNFNVKVSPDGHSILECDPNSK